MALLYERYDFLKLGDQHIALASVQYACVYQILNVIDDLLWGGFNELERCKVALCSIHLWSHVPSKNRIGH